MSKHLVLVSAALAALMACARTLDVVVMFPVATKLSEGDPVMLAGAQVGTVDRIEPAAERIRVVLALDPRGAATLTSNAAAVVVGRTVELHNALGGRPLAAGDELLAIDSTLELMAWRAGNAIDRTNKRIAAAVSALNEYFTGPDWARQKRRIHEGLADLEQSLDGISDEFKRDLNSLLEDLEIEAERHSEHLARRYEALIDRLAQLERDLTERGQQHLLPELEKIMDAVREAVRRYLREPPVPEDRSPRST